MKLSILFFLLVLFLPFMGHAQSVQVEKEDSRIGGKNITGYQVALAASENEVLSSLSRYLKAKGKTRQSGDFITLEQPLLGGIQYAGTLYATIKQNGGNAAAWMGMPSEEPGPGEHLERLVHDFGVTFYREKIQDQIDESLRALQAVEKQQARLASQNKDLNTRLGNNKREKIELEKSLVNNRIEFEDLTKKLEANAKAQDSISMATGQIRKVVEMHQQRQRGVQ